MDVEYKDPNLERLEDDPRFIGRWTFALAKSFREKINYIRKSDSTTSLYAWKGLHFEKLEGDKSHLHSIRLNDQYRLEFQVIKKHGKDALIIYSIGDYH